MIQISVDTRRAVVTNKETLTAGSAGIQVEFTLSEDWDALSKLAVFRVGDDGTKVDVVLGESLTCVVPPEVLTQEDEVLFIGIYGANGQGTVIIPTVWASAGVVKPGTEPETPASATPTPEIWAQILGVANDAEQTATEAMSAVEAGLQDLSTLEGNVETAEAQRVVNEQDRVAAEQQRVLAENNREAAENTRASTETVRVNAETGRVTAETGRVTAENARVSAESARVTAEQARVAAEENRESHYAEYVTTVQGYANAASASATSAAGSAADAASSASSASTSAGQAASSASSASSSASQASNSASFASTSATTASSAATTATTKAGEAAASATAAGNAQTAAETAQTAAETAQSAAESAQAAAEEAAESIEESAAQIAQNTQDISDVKNAIGQLDDVVNDPVTGLAQKAPLIVNTASGDIASFPDGADDMPIKSLVASIEPVQDLHGYDSPWPGGGGANKFDKTTAVANERFSPNGTVSYAGTSRSGYIPCSPNTEYYFLNVHGAAIMSGVFWFDANKQYIDNSIGPVTSPASYVATSPANAAFVGINFRTEDLDTVAVNYPSTVTTYSPYANECPISGHTGMTVYGCGVDYTKTGQTDGYRLDGSGGLIASAAYTTTDYIDVHEFRKVFFGSTWASSAWIWRVARFNQAKTFIDETDSSAIMQGEDVTFDVGNAYYVRISVPYLNVTCYAYTGTTIPITWETEAGTVYSGYIDVVSGKLMVDRAKIVLDGTQTGILANWRSNAESVGWLYPKNVTPGIYGSTNDFVIPNLISDRYKTVSYSVIYGATYDCITIVARSLDWSIAMRSTDTSLTTQSAINAYFAQNPVTVVYKLAEPVEYTLTANELTTLLGQNNVWTDVGEVSVDYPADTKLYIDNKITTAIANALNA